MLDEVAAVDPYSGQLVTYIADIPNQAGYTMEQHRSLDNDFHAIDGILVSGARESDDAQLNALTYTLVTYGEQAGAASVDVDNAAGIKLAKQHLVDAGYEQLIYLGLDLDEQFAQARLEVFLILKFQSIKKIFTVLLTMTTLPVVQFKHFNQHLRPVSLQPLIDSPLVPSMLA